MLTGGKIDFKKRELLSLRKIMSCNENFKRFLMVLGFAGKIFLFGFLAVLEIICPLPSLHFSRIYLNV